VIPHFSKTKSKKLSQ